MIKASAARVALRFAARSGPPMQMGSAVMLKKQGLTPVDVFFGEARPHRRPIIGLGDAVQTRRGDLLYFAGLASDGNAVLGKDEREAERLHSKIIKNRLHHSTRAASTNTERNFFKAKDDQWYVENENYHDYDEYDEYREPDFTTYGPFRSFDAAEKWIDANFANSGGYTEDDSGRARVPRDAVKPRRQRMRFFGSQPLQLQPDYDDHPCKNGGPCQCGGSCGCGGK